MGYIPSKGKGSGKGCHTSKSIKNGKACLEEKIAGMESKCQRSKEKEQKIKGRERIVAHCSRVKTQGESDKGKIPQVCIS